MADHLIQVVGLDLDQVALLHVLNTLQLGATQAANVEDDGEAALDIGGLSLKAW
jgi:hypothetical protein